MGLGLYGSGMHGFILDEMELGTRVASCLDQEACGFGVLFDLSYEEWVKNDLAKSKDT